jgi:hypothetical protein
MRRLATYDDKDGEAEHQLRFPQKGLEDATLWRLRRLELKCYPCHCIDIASSGTSLHVLWYITAQNVQNH